jgi:hypothetical protein
MPETYWVAFGIKDDKDCSQRHQALLSAILELSEGAWWMELPSFVLFRSEAPLELVASQVEKVLNTATDLALVGKPTFRKHLAVGAIEDPKLYELLRSTQHLRGR